MFGAGVSLALSGGACSHTQQAEYHQAKADEAASHRNYYQAADQQQKSDIERGKAVRQGEYPVAP
jgi:hypothetical protein